MIAMRSGSRSRAKGRPWCEGPGWSAKPAAIAAAVLFATLMAGRAAAGDAQSGAQIFKANCARCHGASAKGDGPDLVKLQAAVTPDDWTDGETNRGLADDFIVSMITKGGKANGKSAIMPAFGDKLSGEQIQDLVAFIRSVAK
ncbi:MAG TPA: cytochrome c [Candidatus Binataceae bacterium]|nr:cytochrome c [Candidatus Binataceae bacterium]